MTLYSVKKRKKNGTLRESMISALSFTLFVRAKRFAIGGAFAGNGQNVVEDYVEVATPNLAVQMVSSGDPSFAIPQALYT